MEKQCCKNLENSFIYIMNTGNEHFKSGKKTTKLITNPVIKIIMILFNLISLIIILARVLDPISSYR